MRGRKNPPLDLTPAPDGTPLTFDTMARAYLEDYVLQRYRTLTDNAECMSGRSTRKSLRRSVLLIAISQKLAAL